MTRRIHQIEARLRPGLLAVGAMALLITFTAVPGNGASSEAPPDLSGDWQLNEELSEDPREAMRRSRSGRGGFGAQGRGGGGGRGGGFGRGGRGQGGFGRGGGRGGEQQGRGGAGGERMNRFSLEHQDPQLTFRFEDGQARTLTTDGETRTHQHPSGEVRTEASWRGNQLVIKRQHDGGRKVKETYQLDAESGRLLVTTKLEGGARSMSFRRVYDSVAEGVEQLPREAPPD